MKNILLKHNLVTILPFQDTFFYATTLPKNIKLSKELLKINYLKYSPYKNADLLGYLNEKHLMLWFYTENTTSPVIIPESFILYQALKNQNSDAIYIIEDHLIKILVIKNGYLLSAFTMQTLDEDILALTLDEFQIKDKITISNEEYKSIYKDAFKSLALTELYHFNQLDLDVKSITTTLFDSVAYPLSAIIIFAIMVNIIHTSHLNSQIEELQSHYITERDKNKAISQEIRKHNNDVKKWRAFADKELLYVDPMRLLSNVHHIIKPKEKVIIKEISISNANATLKLQTNLNPVLFLNRLSKNRYIQSIIIQNTRQPKKSEKIITYNISLKPLKES